jgi:hypothetical protein
LDDFLRHFLPTLRVFLRIFLDLPKKTNFFLRVSREKKVWWNTWSVDGSIAFAEKNYRKRENAAMTILRESIEGFDFDEKSKAFFTELFQRLETQAKISFVKKL